MGVGAADIAVDRQACEDQMGALFDLEFNEAEVVAEARGTWRMKSYMPELSSFDGRTGQHV